MALPSFLTASDWSVYWLALGQNDFRNEVNAEMFVLGSCAVWDGDHSEWTQWIK
jgi:hypothetical protein